MIFLRRDDMANIINHAMEVEADFYLFTEVAADGYSTRSEMMAASLVKHRERWASWFHDLLLIITGYTLPYIITVW